ncbi:pyridoxamine 5'-phosphate oxidase family protein [Nocardioides humilatus]|uniref:Pyridoxamine 5'-phosphate oxidase family protein n=1 Tax=Nocardioides humilatus TaxID=2607660 RepID=A0A5B1LAP7_9ACTN|nr:pyridoxamine 5'-phosphate oxidase family protein [Nocardioides humilatus]KAA1417811.1 pyridoxamine 5'-phosphate oxidase family protein [Nocardioides humilatus]
MSTDHWYSSKLRDIPHPECIHLLQSQQVGRIAFEDDSGPDVLPINYAMDGEDILISTSAYGVVARAATNSRVAFEVDSLDDYTESGWSVVVRGRATHESPLIPPSGEHPHPWADGTRSYHLRIVADVVRGRRLIPA